jgi:hypothetical protein
MISDKKYAELIRGFFVAEKISEASAILNDTTLKFGKSTARPRALYLAYSCAAPK